MQLAQVLDILRQLLLTSAHPEIAAVDRFGTDPAPGGPSPAGLRVRYDTGSEAYLWGAVWPGETPLPVPEILPPPSLRAARAAAFAAQLLDAARPAAFRSWELLALPDLGPADARGKVPLGVRITCADGPAFLIRATAAGGPTREPDTEPHPGYRIPEALTAG
ncbi:hypothetical protein ACWT_1848 [Actinoplanes sp. SE50]|uniref:hypothetical protein n=1 Tax=unclassified Actinoplanes TaxID=2626549 RepID=UPI00023EBB2D|nr:MULTISPECIES: hypothetical protein [unclassified Actinoplanes]AEV82867.1 hypothetical protein ACPL_1970 [Actinoplanes sp. SE50/110]ATO81263.1 hypothetical protein ACWT_1848 [Actinoplanes sp. SE50]SLL98670.1 hypothetical protein ACSP50_1897 [Actinoplanes sp. SE50/110]